MKKGLKIIGVVVLILIVLFSGLYIWLLGFKEDQKETEAKKEKIKNSYTGFSESVDALSKERDKYYEYQSNLYLEELGSSAEGWNNFMKEYQSAIQLVYDKSKDLRENCNVVYGDAGINSKCTTFKANYEAAFNYYINDVKSYNEIVDEYNTWRKSQTKEYKEVNKASYVVYQDYIDYDEDGEYFGKEVSSDGK